MTDEERFPQEDERGAQSPAEDDEVEDEQGPIGNPASDEEALGQRQQETDPPPSGENEPSGERDSDGDE